MNARTTGLAIASLSSMLALGLACRPQPSVAPRPGDPVTLVSPDTGPSAMQHRLAALEPARTAAGSAALDARIDAFFGKIKSRRGYLAVDKPLYQPGETIWFRLFDLASADLDGGADRSLATVKLISPRGSTAIEKVIALDPGGAGNDLALAGDLPGGEYRLVAETRAGTRAGTETERRVIVASYEAPRIKKKLELTRKAYGPGDTVTATVAVHRATGEPLARRELVGLVTLDGADLGRVPVTTDTEGNAVVTFALPAAIQRGDGLLTVLVDDGGVTESVQKRIPITLKDLQLALYPEGGDLVAGLPGRVYFAAKNPLDKPADIEGRVVDDRGQLVALLRSYHDGMGRFELYPERGRRYRVEIARPAGIARTFELPAARDAGCAMQSIDDAGSARPDLRIALWCTSARQLTIAAVLRDRRIASAAVDVRGGEPTVVALAMPAGVQGAVRVTAFDDRLAPQAERLIYRNRGRDLKITLVADRPTYHPRDPVKLAVQTRGPDGAPVAADLAISAVDDTVLAFADDKQATLLARMYLEAELPGQKIEEPNFYFSDDKQAPAALDLVLGTAGWRRFDWKPVLSAPSDPPIEDPWRFTGAFTPERKHRAQPMRKRAAVDASGPLRGGNNDDDRDELEDEDDGLADQQDRRRAREPADLRAMKQPKAPAPAEAIQGEDERKGAKVERPRKADVRAFAAAKRPPPREAPAAALAPPPKALAANAGAPAIADEELAVLAMQEARGEAIVITGHAEGRGFAIGGELEPRLHRIRGVRDRADDEDPDPMCCVAVIPEREFAQPSYTGSYDGPRTDFRETIAWRSRLRTDAAGNGELSFFLSDAVTSFKVVAEGAGGGRLGHGEALVQSKKPVSLAVKLPLEVSAGDHVRLPVTIANETDQRYRAVLAATFGKAFTITGGALAPNLDLAPGERRSAFYELDVTADGTNPEDGKIALAVEAANLRDEVTRTIRVVSPGFPQQAQLAGTLTRTVRHEVVITDALPGTLRGTLTMYPSPLATMVQGTEAMIAEPGGCFEQASSTNYPNIMILGYLEENRAAAPAIVEKAHSALDHGYKLLTGYETPTKGYEWFGANPGHEALTAYGLMEFHDMAKVYGDVDRTMIDRTRDWLRSRRDGKGGFLRNPQQLDSFGGASPEVTDAYITYALSEAGERDLTAELGKQRRSAASTRDPYLLALATKVLIAQAPTDDATRGAIQRLAAMQGDDGSFPGADHSITRSGGEALAIETTSLATLALLAAGAHTPEVRKSIEWLDKHRNGFGGYGSTQSTVLALKAMAAYAKDSRRTAASGTVTLVVNGTQIGKLSYDKGHQGALELPLAQHLKPGKNVIEITLESTEPLPYSARIEWGSKLPASDPATAVRLATRIARSTVKLGETAHVDVEVRNATDHGVPMTLARVGLPGGLTFQTWQLQELRDKHLIDFYETRPREVILYFRSLGPGAVKSVPLELMATVPGTFTSPASRAYLYYTNERKHWVAPSTVTILL